MRDLLADEEVEEVDYDIDDELEDQLSSPTDDGPPGARCAAPALPHKGNLVLPLLCPHGSLPFSVDLSSTGGATASRSRRLAVGSGVRRQRQQQSVTATDRHRTYGSLPALAIRNSAASRQQCRPVGLLYAAA